MKRTLRRHYKSAGVVHDVELARDGDTFRGTVDGTPHAVGAVLLRRLGAGAEVAITLGDGAAAPAARAIVVRDGDLVHVAVGGRTFRLHTVQPRPGGEAAAADAVEDFAASPMTGTVRKVLVAAGDGVRAGATLVVVEAMKMEFAVTAPRDVVVGEVRAAEGDRVEIQQVLVTFVEPGGSEDGGAVEDAAP